MLQIKSVLFAAFMALGSLSMSVSAAIVQFDLLGRAGVGLLPGNENPANTSGASGGEVGAGVFFNDVSKGLTLNLGWGTGNGFTNLTGAATGFHIHNANSASFTVNGPVIIDFIDLAIANASAVNGGIFNQTVFLTAAQEGALLSNFLYVNVHTAANPGGQIRGNLVAVPVPGTLTLVALSMTGLVYARKRHAKKQA
jgi:CHRD domain